MSKLRLLARIAIRDPREFSDRIEAIISSRVEERFGKRREYTGQAVEDVLSAIMGKLTQSLDWPKAVDLEGVEEIEAEVQKRMQMLEAVAPFTTRHHADLILARLCYTACRVLKPEVVVETGVAYGVTTAFVLKALQVNGRGRLHSIDLPPLGENADAYVGYLVPEVLREPWTLYRGVSKRVLPKLLPRLGQVDLFIHDSLHTYRNIRRELETVSPYLGRPAVVVADDVQGNRAFSDWVKNARPAYWAVVREEGKAALAGYIILNYGFSNFAPPGSPFAIGYLLSYGALSLAVLSNPSRTKVAFREPAIWWCGGLLGLSILHLVADLPRYGLYAIRDATLTFEMAFLLLGFFWGIQKTRVHFLRALAFVFLFNLIYAGFYPWASHLQAISPKSGVFRQVALLGSYSHTALFLLVGALFFWLLGRAIGWPKWVLTITGMLQIGGLLILQSRAIYITALLSVAVLFLLGDIRKGIKSTALIGSGVLLLTGILTIFGMNLQGRIGPVNLAFIIEHFQSIFLRPGNPLVGSTQWHLALIPEIIGRVTSSPWRLIIGEGFGEPLIDFIVAGGVAVRQPHNTHLSVLARLGLVGLVFWILFLVRVGTILVRCARRGPRGTFEHNLWLWLLLFFVSGLAFTTFQPWLEFPYGAIPFYTIIGFGLGLFHKNASGSQPLLAAGR
jgi:hypothetical protein